VSMLRYAAMRLVIVIPVIFVMLVLTFLLTHVLPSNPAVLASGPNATAAQVAAKEHQLGLDRPLPAQLATYLGQLAQGNLGRSIRTNNSVVSDLSHRIPATLLLISVSLFFGFILAIGMALWTADREKGPAAHAGRLFGNVGSAMPDYFIGILLILILYVWLAVVPAPLGQAGAGGSNVPSRTGSYLIDATLAGNGGAIWSAIKHMILPVLTLSLACSPSLYRVARASIEDARRAKFVDYAMLMGCSPKLVRRRVIRNAAPPILTLTGVIYGLLLGGAVIVETIFAWGGAGQYAVDAIANNDFNAVQGFVLVAGVFSVFVYLLVDLLHAALDPRVRGMV
jgi:ABC-type dipeptide/oligopeptide/nickel transport system permease component